MKGKIAYKIKMGINRGGYKAILSTNGYGYTKFTNGYGYTKFASVIRKRY